MATIKKRVRAKYSTRSNSGVRCTSYKVIDGNEVIKRTIENPEAMIGVKSSRIYAQIAKTGRHPEQASSKMKLIKVLGDSRKVTKSNGHVTLIREPTYIPMRAKDVQICFGEEIRRMPSGTFVEIK